jgi:hypothetical protein
MLFPALTFPNVKKIKDGGFIQDSGFQVYFLRFFDAID